MKAHSMVLFCLQYVSRFLSGFRSITDYLLDCSATVTSLLDHADPGGYFVNIITVRLACVVLCSRVDNEDVTRIQGKHEKVR